TGTAAIRWRSRRSGRRAGSREPHRAERLAVRRLEGRLLLPGGSPAARVAPVLRHEVLDRRGEQLLLSPARGRHVRAVVPRDPGGLRRDGEGESLHHAPEAAPRPRGADRAVLGASDAARAAARTGAVPAATAVPLRSGPAGTAPRGAPGSDARRLRVPRPRLARAGRVRSARTGGGGARVGGPPGSPDRAPDHGGVDVHPFPSGPTARRRLYGVEAPSLGRPD